MEIVIHFFIIILVGVFPITICLEDLGQMFSQFKSKEFFFFLVSVFYWPKPAHCSTTCLFVYKVTTNLFTFFYSLLSSFKPKANYSNHHPVITVGYTMWMSTASLFRPEFRWILKSSSNCSGCYNAELCVFFWSVHNRACWGTTDHSCTFFSKILYLSDSCFKMDPKEVYPKDIHLQL